MPYLDREKQLAFMRAYMAQKRAAKRTAKRLASQAGRGTIAYDAPDPPEKSSTIRMRVWREKNPERNRVYMREYLRAYRAKKRAAQSIAP